MSLVSLVHLAVDVIARNIPAENPTIRYAAAGVQRLQDSRAESALAPPDGQHPSSTPREIGGKHLQKVIAKFYTRELLCNSHGNISKKSSISQIPIVKLDGRVTSRAV